MAYQVTRQQVIDAALECRGAKFQHQGRSLETGIDCVGLAAVVLEKVNYPKIVDVEAYRSSPPASIIYETLSQNFDEIAVSRVKPGDLYLMTIGAGSAGRKPKHVSFLISDETNVMEGIEPQIIHAYALGGKGRVIVEPLSAWKHRCVKGFRLRGLKD